MKAKKNKKKTKGKKKQNGLFTVLLVLILIIGLSFLLYPKFSNYWNSFNQSHAISGYVQAVEQLAKDEYKQFLKDAHQFNKDLLLSNTLVTLTGELYKRYMNTLNVGGSGIMGYLEVPKIDCKLPIYHGTAESVLQIAIGHLPGSSLPVGGKGTHCVLSGHRGLPSAKLFTDLDRMEVGDEFTITVLSEVLTYEVDQILIVLPNEKGALRIEPNKDLCTLLTCTPYGINSHRLLVRGHRIDTAESLLVKADAIQIQPLLVALVLAAIIIFSLLVWLFTSTHKRKETPHN